MKLTQAEIVARAESLIDEFCMPLGGRKALILQGLQFDRLYEELIYPEYGIELDENTDLGFVDGEKVFGFFDPVANKAYIDVSLRNDPRRPFTLWHEVVGHGILQGDWLRRAMKQGILTTQEDLSPNTEDVLERQANLCAANAAAPLWLVDCMIVRIYRPTKPFLYFGPSGYWLEANGRSRKYQVFSLDDLCQTIARNMQPYFGYLSKEALGYRVRETGWVVDKSQPSVRLFRKSKAPAPARGAPRELVTV